MSDTLTNFKTRIRRYLREPDPTNSFWTDDFLVDMFNLSYHRRCAQLIMSYEGYFTIVGTRSIVANKARYALPSGASRILKLERVMTNGTTCPMRRWERHEEANPAASTTSMSGDDYLPTFRPMANGFILEPTPIENVTNGLRIEFSGLPDKLSGDSDQTHPSFPEIFENLLILDTCVTALDAEGAQETGRMLALMRNRSEIEEDFRRYIESRVTLGTETEPYVGPYWDS